MIKNNTNITPSNNDGEILDSFSTESNLTPNPTQENSQEELTPTNPTTTDITTENEDVVSLDNNISPILITETKSYNITSTKKYRIIISTPTKYILDIDGNGASYTQTEYTKSLNYKFGDEIELPQETEE